MKNPLSKKILFLKVKNQDPEAYSQFYDLYATRIYRYIFFKVDSEADAQDLTSEVFLKCWQYIKEGRAIKNLNALIYIIARNAVIDFYRNRNHREDPLDEAVHSNIIDEKADALGKLIQNSKQEAILSGLKQLKDEYKEVIVMRYLDDLSLKEIAQILNKTNGAVRVLLHRAMKSLQDTIGDKNEK